METGDDDDRGMTVSAALAELRDAITDAGTHSLDASSVARARARVARAVAALRAAADARPLWGPAADRVAQVAADAAQSARQRADAAAVLAACRDLALRSDPFAPPHSVVLHHVKAAAEAAGAQAVEGLPEDGPQAVDAPGPRTTTDGGIPAAATAAEGLVQPQKAVEPEAASAASSPPPSAPGPLLTVCAKTFLADFQFYPHDVSVHFRHLTVSGQELRDPDIDADFVRLVRMEDFPSLQRAFKILVSQEDLDAQLRPAMQLKESLRAFEDDLLTMQAAELAAVPGSSLDDLRDRGHGCIRRSAHGLRIGFSKGYEALLAVEDSVQLREIVTSTTGPILVPPSDPTAPRSLPVSFQFATIPQTASVRAQYVLILERPLVTSTVFAAELERLSGGGSNESTAAAAAAATSASNTDPTATPGPVNGTSLVSRYGHAGTSAIGKSRPHNLECLLVPGLFSNAANDSHGSAHPSGQRSAQKRHRMEILSGGTEVVAPASLPNGKHMTFSYSRGDCSPGVTIHRVPVGRPQDVHSVLKMLRQHLVFNCIFASCFGTASAVSVSSGSELDQPVEVVVCDPPSFIHFGAFDPVEDSVLGVAVTIGTDGIISARIRPERGGSHPCSDMKASALFKLAFNAPLALHGILTIARRARSGGPPSALPMDIMQIEDESGFGIA